MAAKKTVVIVGAGPAGLTAAYELVRQSVDYDVIVIEAEEQAGGISKTVDYRGNKIDIGGHRFFSKSDRVLDWWQQFLPIKGADANLTYQQQSTPLKIRKHTNGDQPHMLLRSRKSRIYHNKQFFDYPLRLGLSTFLKVGLFKSAKIIAGIFYRRLKPIRNEKNLEDFYINRFGDELYNTFFKAYTQKVWGKPCSEISADWGRQRVKALGIRSIVKHYLASKLRPGSHSFANQNTERSLSEFFLYPQQGPGQLWETVAAACDRLGSEIRYQQRLEHIRLQNDQISEVIVSDKKTGESYTQPCDILISTMAIKDLTLSMGEAVPAVVKHNATQLEYRDFLVVGLLVTSNEQGITREVTDNWLYIQDDSVQVGRLQLFHNWSPDMVANEENLWLGAEYFCLQGDALWGKTDPQLIALATQELASLGLVDANHVLDGVVVRMPKAYPSYTGTYAHFDAIRAYYDEIPNLFMVGRNGMHKYNNQDHSMLTAMAAVDNIVSGRSSKENIWGAVSDQEYIES